MSKYACLACMFKNLGLNASSQIIEESTSLISTLLSILGQRSKQCQARL